MASSDTAGGTTRERIVAAALDLLGNQGAAGWSARAAEQAAGVPHGSVRHHFGDAQALRLAMVDALLAADLARTDTGDLATMVAAFLGPEATRTRARYELFLLATRDPDLRARIVAARERLARQWTDLAGIPITRARTLLAALDGLLLDALIRGRDGIDATELTALVAAGGANPGMDPT